TAGPQNAPFATAAEESSPARDSLALRRDPPEHRVDAREPSFRAFLDAVLHRRVALLGRLEAHCLRQPRPLAQVLELESLEVVLKRLHEAFGRCDLAKLAFDDAEAGPEPVSTAWPDVHLFYDRAVAPPFGDQLWIRPDGKDVGARRVEDPLDADLELTGRGDRCVVHRCQRAPFVRSTTCANRSRRCSQVLMPSKA